MWHKVKNMIQQNKADLWIIGKALCTATIIFLVGVFVFIAFVTR
jgi:hypothetical protein